jgi:hypothetical protein
VFLSIELIGYFVDQVAIVLLLAIAGFDGLVEEIDPVMDDLFLGVFLDGFEHELLLALLDLDEEVAALVDDLDTLGVEVEELIDGALATSDFEFAVYELDIIASSLSGKAVTLARQEKKPSSSM